MKAFTLILFLCSGIALGQAPATRPAASQSRTSLACGGIGTSGAVVGMQVQDQDGLGTCYANQVSLLIQNLNRSASPVSYQQIGMSYAMSKGQSNLTTRSGSTRSHVVEGGNGCAAFRAAQQTGFCSMNSFNGFEYANADDPNHIQQLVLNAVSSFIDNHANSTAALTETQWGNIQNHFVALLATRDRECQNKTLLVRDQFSRRAAEAFYNRLTNLRNAKCEGQICNVGEGLSFAKSRWDQLLAAMDRLSPHVMEVRPLQNGVAGARLFDFKPSFKTNFQRALGDGSNLSSKMVEVLQKTLAANVSGRTTNLDSDFKLLFPEAYFYDVQSETYAVSESCSQRWAIADQLENLNLVAVANRDRCNCLSHLTSSKLKEFDDLAAEVAGALRRQAAGRAVPLSERLNSLLRILAPGCESQLAQGRVALRNLKCVHYSLNGEIDGGETATNRMLSAEFPQPAARRKAATDVTLRALCSGKAVGVDVCTGFMTASSNVDTSFCEKNNVPGITGHGYHAMTLVGFKRDAQGRTRYLVQNSWGRNCSFEGKGKDIVCEKVEGRPTGRFWITEELLWNNTTNMNIVMSGSATP